MTNPPDTSVTERVALLRCPFCNAPAERVAYAGGRRVGLRCANLSCGCALRLGLPGEDLTEAWNTRAAISSMPALEEENARLREALQGLEAANGALCGKRSRKTYFSMLDDGCEDELLALDGARRVARAALSPRKEDQQTKAILDGCLTPSACSFHGECLTRKDGSEDVKALARAGIGAALLVAAKPTRQRAFITGYNGDPPPVPSSPAMRVAYQEGIACRVLFHAALTSTREGLSTEGEEG